MLLAPIRVESRPTGILCVIVAFVLFAIVVWTSIDV